MSNDLTADSLAELLAHIKSENFKPKPFQLIFSKEHLERAQEMAQRDPEFHRHVVAEFGIDLLAGFTSADGSPVVAVVGKKP